MVACVITSRFTDLKAYAVIDSNIFLPWVYANEIPLHFIHEIAIIAYDVIDTNVFPRKLARFPRKKGD